MTERTRLVHTLAQDILVSEEAYAQLPEPTPWMVVLLWHPSDELPAIGDVIDVNAGLGKVIDSWPVRVIQIVQSVTVVGAAMAYADSPGVALHLVVCDPGNEETATPEQRAALIEHIAKRPVERPTPLDPPTSPLAWTEPHENGKTYTRSEVLNLIEATRHQSTGEAAAREWAIAMLDIYDADSVVPTRKRGRWGDLLHWLRHEALR